jgi:aminotransferase
VPRGDLVDLSRGDPDHGPPAVARAAVADAVARADSHRYPDPVGAPELRQSFVRFYARRYGVSLDPDEEMILVPGTRTAILALAAIAADDGDGVLVPDPGYPDYFSAALLAGARIIRLRLDEDAEYQPDWSSISANRPSLAFLNYPSNPLGVCAATGTFEVAVEQALQRGMWLVNDFAYSDIGLRVTPRSILAVDGARECAAELWSASKTFGMAGWRIGFLVGNATLVARVRRFLAHVTGGVWSGFQSALLAALDDPRDAYIAERCSEYAERQRAFAAHADVAVPPATYYCWWRVGSDADSIERDTGVRLTDGALFGPSGAGYVRASLTVPSAVINRAAERLRLIGPADGQERFD